MASSGRVLLRWLMAVAVAAVIYAASSLPIPVGAGPGIPHFDKVVHFVSYGVLALFCFRALWSNADRAPTTWILLVGMIMATIYGALMEFHQGFIPTRDFDVYDMIANGLGASAATMAWEPLGRRYEWLR